MPDQTVTIKANVQTTGLDNAVNNSSKVHENLSASARAAQQLERFANNAGDALRRTAAAGGGVQPAATQAMAGATQARAAAFAGSRSPRETVEYGMARGAMGATGASARDFANQAQGLGGLVRLYATYAANIFAVEAAFRALNEAAKTEQMVRGLDQLGGAGGRALGALSKQLVNVTDGAISLRDAMTAVAQTSSAGMSSQNILKLGTAAQKASQVLGLNMTDAINRLSRGITKLEPELLDELGVFVRIDDAAEQYARTLGKTTSSLTEFERRTGFAVAVLKQLDEKFGTIELDTNPYDKLAASLSNLTTAGLEILNKFLKPVVDFLAQSPAALAGGIAALLSLVVKQALPVVGMYKEYLAKMREQSLAQVAQTSQAYSSAIIKNRQLAVKAAEAEAEARSSAIDKAEEKLSAIRQSKFVQEKARVMEILTKPTQLITQDDLNYLQKQSDKNAKTNADLAKSYLEVKDTIIASKKAEGDYAVASKSLAEAKLLASEQVVGSYKNELKFKELSRKATIDETVANVNRYAKETNFLSAIYKGLSEINVKAKEYTQLIPKLDQKGKPTGEFESITMTKNFSTTEKLMAGTRVVTAGLASGLEKLISTAGTLGLAIGAISGVIALLKSAFTDNAKEAKDYEQALVSLQGAAKAADETLRALSKQQSGKFLSPESILARAQAVYNLSEALDDTVAKAGLYNATLNDFGAGLNKLDQIFGEGAKRAGEAFRKNVGGLTGTLVGGGLEGFGRLFQGIFGTDKITELSNGLAEAVNKTYKLARNAQERTQIQSLAKQIYGSETDISNLDHLVLKK
jgi:hypothetical protein